MKYENLLNYSEKHFRLATGLKRSTFDKAVEILNKKYAEEHSRNTRNSGRKSKLSMEDKLLATLEYLREHRTYFHIASSYGVAESSIIRATKWVENTLIKDGTFKLPGRKALLASDHVFEVVLIDVSESPIQRPKKNRKDTILARKNDTQ